MTVSSQLDVRGELICASRTGNEAGVRHYAAQGVVDKKVLGVALHLAVAGKHTECCRVLLFSGADVDEKNSTGNTCMHVAAEAGSQEVMELLFEFQASLNIRNADGKCAIAVSKNPATRQLISGEVKRRAEATEQRKRFRASFAHDSQNAGREKVRLEKNQAQGSPGKQTQGSSGSVFGNRSPLGPKNGDNCAAPSPTPVATSIFQAQGSGTPELLMCRVCLRDFCSEPKTDPVSLPCGHTFCSTCIASLRGLNSRGATPHSFRCPLDRQVFSRNLEFNVNTLLREIIPLIRSSCGLASHSDDKKKVVGELRAEDTQHRPTVEAGTTTADMHDVAVSPMTPIALPGAQDIGLSPIFPFQLLLRRNTTGQSPSNALTPTLLHGVKPRLTPPSVKRRTTPPHAPPRMELQSRVATECAPALPPSLCRQVESVLDGLVAEVCRDVAGELS